jgi:hypothetical protein
VPTTRQLINQALDALKPMRSCDKPNQQQVTEGHARGVIALAQAVTDLNTTLTDLADQQPGTPDPCQEADLLPAIHHSA